MSTKTVTKRVALATVVALGAGVLSLVSVTSATAASTNLPITNQSNNPAVGINQLNIAQYNSVTGSGVLTNSTDASTARSFGLTQVTDAAGNVGQSTNPSSGVTAQATLLANGTLSVFESVSGVQYDAIVVSGAKIISAGASNGTASANLNASQTVAWDSPTVASYTWGALIQPNSGVTSFTVQLYTNTGSTSSYSAGTLSGQILVTVASASVAGVASQSKSGIYYMGNYGSYAAGTNGLTGDTTTGTPGTSAWNVAQIADVRIRDAYTSPITTNGLISVTATNGAYVAITAHGTMSSSGATATASSSSAPYATDYDNVGLTVLPSVSTASSTTVTVSYNGVVVGVKSFSFTGKVASVVLSNAGNGTVSQNPNLSAGTGANYGNVATVKFLDSAGNQVYPDSAGTSYPKNLAKGANTAGTGVSFTAGNTYWASAASSTAVFSCGSLNATGSLALDYTNLDGTVISSNTVSVSCSGNAYTYSAKLDKAKYAPGDIATLTVTFKDSLGALSSDQTGTVAASADTNAPSIYAGNALILTGGSSTTTAGSKTDSTTNGVIKYTFIAGNTSGSYALNVDFPHVDALSGQAALQVPFTIADGSTSLNDVLKGIVSLIASINKQIAALAKLVTKK